MTDKQAEQKTGAKSGESIGFLRAAEKMQISTFEIPLTFLEDLGFSQDKIQAAKYMNRQFISGFYDRVRGIGQKLSFGGSSKSAPKAAAQPKSAAPQSAQARAAEPKKPAKAEEGTVEAPVTAKTTEDAPTPETVVKPKPQGKKQSTKTAKAEGKDKPKPKAKGHAKKSIEASIEESWD